MANPFDQFDAPATSNPFDAFDDPSFKPPKPSGLLRRGIGDTAVSLGKGVIGLGEGAVGLSSLATGGLAGQLAEQAGFRPKEAKAMLDEFYSPEQQAANRAVSDAKGFGGTLSSILQNPSVVPQMVAESLPSMIGGQAIAKGALKAAGLAGEAITPTAARWAGAGGEGAITAGGVAEQIRQEAPDGNIYAAVPAGVATGLIGVAGGKFANRMGLGDVDTALLTAANRGTASLPKRILGGVASEGLLEEMPQSMQEQFFQNLGTGKPLGEGVAEAGASGLVTGGAMGGAFGILHKPAGPLSRAADTSIQSGAAQEQQRVAAEHAAQAIGQPPSSAQAVSRGDSAPSTEESPVRTTSSDADQQNSSSSPLGLPQYNGPTQYVHPDGSVSTDPQAIRSAIEAERIAALAPQPYDAPLEEAKATRREQMARAVENARQLPTTNVLAAQKKADELTQETGVPHGVVATGKKASGKPLVVVQAQAEAVLQDSTNAGGADGKDNLEKSVATQGSQSSQVPVLGVGNRGLDAAQAQGARHAGVEVGRALSGNDGVAEEGQTATSVGTVAQGANVQDAPNVSDKTPDQLAYLSTNGKPGWKEAAQAEIQRRSLSSKGSPIVNQVVKDSSTTQPGQISGQETAKTSANAGVSSEISADRTHSEINAKIADAEKSGIRLSENDKSAIRQLQSEADDLNRRANRTSALGSDPMGKGNAFPMGVGFTKMTKRKSQAIDSSVRRAGEAVELYKRAQTKQGQIERMLSGKDTEAYHEEELAKTERFQRAIVDKLLNWKRGDKIGKNVIERVSLDKDGYPSSFTVSGDGIIKGIWDKTDIARDYFDGDKEKLRRMVDDVRQSTKLQAVTDQPQPATNQPKPAAKDGAKATPTQQSGNVSGGLTAGESNAITPATNQGVQNGQEKGRRQEVLTGGAKAPSVQQERTIPRGKARSLLELVRRNGGIHTRLQSDIAGDKAAGKRGFPVGVFRSNGLGEDRLAELLQQHGYLSEADVNSAEDTSGSGNAMDMVRRALNGERIVPIAEQEAERANAHEQEYRDRIRNEAKELGIPTVARKFSEFENAVLWARQAKHDREVADLDAQERAAYDEILGNVRDSGILSDSEIADLIEQNQNTILYDLMGLLDTAHRSKLDDINEQLRQAREPRQINEEDYRNASQAERDGQTDAAAAREGQGNGGEATNAGQTQPGFSLAAQTPEELRAREEGLARQRDQEAEAQRNAEQKAQADAEVGSFTLTGSDRAADVAASHGQGGLFDQGEPPPSVAKENSPEQPKQPNPAPANPAWFTDIPDTGVPLTKDQLAGKPRAYEAVPSLIAEEAWNAITQTQRTSGIGLYAYVIPAEAGRNGAVRLFPDDQTPPSPWKLLDPQVIRQGAMTKEQGVAKLREMLRNAPIIGDKAAIPTVPAKPAAQASTQGKENAVSLTNGAANVKESAKTDTRSAENEQKAPDSVSTGEQKGGAKFSRNTTATTIDSAALKQTVAFLRKAYPQATIREHESDQSPTVPKALRDDIANSGAQDDVAGAYKDGVVHVFRSGIRDQSHAEKTIVHELTHRGLARMFGLGIKQPMLGIYASNADIATEADRIAKQYGYDRATAVEEALADLGGDMVSVNGFDKLVAYVRAALRKLGLVSQWSDNDVALLVQRAREKNKGGFTESAKFSRAGQQGIGARLADAMRGGKKAAEPATQAAPSANGARWQAPEASKMDDVIYSLQDKQVDMRRVVESIKKTSGGLSDAVNPYLQEELFHGRAAKGVKDFLDLELRPLMMEMRMRGVAMTDFEEYLWNRHAEERNAQIAKINHDMPDGGSGIKTADAQAYLSGLPADKRKAYEALSKRIDTINAKTRQLLVSSGLETQDTIDAWSRAYQNYVPLQREDVETGGNGTGQGFSVRGSASKRAVGSGRPVADILGNIAMQREKTIVRAEKNRVATAVLGLATENPNPDFWRVDEAPRERVVEKIGGQDQVVERIVPGFRSQDNVVMARINGKDHFVIFNEREPRALRMAQALKNLDSDQLGRVLSGASRATRYFASINTQFNPIFGVINLMRDTQGALLNLSTTPIRGEQRKVLGYTVDALRGIYADLRAHRAGQVPSSSWAQLWEEFQKEGGQTGYRDQFSNAEQRAEAIAKEIKSLDRHPAIKAGGAIFDWLSDYNDTMENAVRLAAYRTAKERGLSNQEAASLAKNLTVNFNRKGQVATQMGALYAFFNASVQGTARLGETLTGPMGRRIVKGGILLGAMQAMLLAAAGMGDDEPPEFVRERSLILPIGGGKYLSLPMPLGFHLLPNLGRIPTEFVMGGFKNPAARIADLVGLFADTFNPIGNAGLSLQTIAPTVVDPFAALAENRDWTGKPIAKTDMSPLSPTPGHSRAKDTATTWSKAIAYGINWLSGGTEFKQGLVSPTPDQIDYLIGQATGGVGREASKLEQIVSSGLSGEDMPLYKVPLVGRFVGDTAGQSAEGGKFYAAIKRINEHETEIKGLRSSGRGDEAMDYIQENPEARLVLAANAFERQVQQLRKLKRANVEAGDTERVKMIEQQITDRMHQFNERVASLQ